MIKDKIKRALRYIWKGIPNRNTTVNVAQIHYGGILDNEKILITGGTRGLGLAIAKRALEEKAKVSITGRSMERLLKVKEELGNPEHLYLFEHDMRDFASHAELIQNARKAMGGIDTLVNNAGVSVHHIDYSNCTEEQWDLQMDTNLKGTYFLTQAYMAYYESVGKKSGHIIIMVSERGLYGDDVPYGLSKRALISYTEGLAKQTILKGVRVNAIAPGVTATEMTGHNPDGNLFRQYARGRRVLLPEEIAEVTVFLMSKAANCISGQVIACNEGNHLK